jgi:hypothetical protein
MRELCAKCSPLKITEKNYSCTFFYLLQVGTRRAIPTAMERTPTPRGRCNSLHPVLHDCPLLLLIASMLGCGAVGAGPSQPPSSTPVVTVGVAPSTATVLLGGQQTFIATLNNSTNPAVTWSVNGISGGNATVGTISAGGTYTAPANLPATVLVSVTATSVEDSTKSFSAQATISSDISVSISPQIISVELGASQPFTASVNSAGTPNRSVTWVLSGSGCAGAACGSVDSSGTYTAPQILPTPPSASLIAVSAADSSRTATVSVNLSSTFSVSIDGPASVDAGTSATYAATITPAANSNPARAIFWSIAGTGCAPPVCGTITQAGVYTAPTIPPSPSTLKIVAIPLADPTKASSFAISVIPVIEVAITPPSASVLLGATQNFQAVVTGAADATVTWDVNGIVGGNATVGSILNSQISPNSTTYTAPQILPTGGTVTVRARSNASPGSSANVSVTLNSSIILSLNPSASFVAVGERQTFSLQIAGTANGTATWTVNGIAGGNRTVGQICVTGSNPCQPELTSGPGSVDYVAPAGMPSPNPVAITAASQVDSTKNASSSVTILPHVAVSVQPGTITLADTEPLRFTAVVTGSLNQQVIWRISGIACGVPANCGSIDATGLYTAPARVPSPALIALIATSTEDTSQSGSATVILANSPAIFSFAPTSAYAGTAGGFTLLVTGINFVPASPGPGSTILVGGTPRSTNCASTTQCITSLSAADLQSAGNLSVQLQNPDGTLSNAQIFVVLAQGSGISIVPLTPSAPTSTGNDIVVVDLSTNGGAGSTGNVSLSIAAIGPYSPSTGSCTLAGNPVVLHRPVSGTGSGDLCVFSVSGLSASFSFSVSGPTTPDITVINREPLGLGILHLSLSVPSTSAAGARTLFIANQNGDVAAGTGVIVVQ